MTQFLPPNLLALFAPRDPIPYLAPTVKLPHEKASTGRYSGVSQFMADFEDPKETPAPTRAETKEEREERKARERAEQIAYKLEQDLALWDPHSGGNLTEDAFKTLFVARINYESSESKLRREFEVYGPIKTIKLVHNNTNGKPRGYAFIEYEHERDMHSAYKHADGKKIDDRRVLVDVERARTVKGWRPRRLGGGLGGTRKGKDEDNVRFSGRDDGGDRRERSRSREKEKRRRSRSRERKRSRSRERRRDRDDRDDRKRSRSRDRKRNRRSRSRERKRSRSRDRKRSRRSRSRERKRDRDRDVKVKTEKETDGYPGGDYGDTGQAADQLPEGQEQKMTEYPPPAPEEQTTNGD